MEQLLPVQVIQFVRHVQHFAVKRTTVFYFLAFPPQGRRPKCTCGVGSELGGKWWGSPGGGTLGLIRGFHFPQESFRNTEFCMPQRCLFGTEAGGDLHMHLI